VVPYDGSHAPGALPGRLCGSPHLQRPRRGRQEETASDVARLTAEVAQPQADLRLTREELSEVVRERITENKSKDSALFKARRRGTFTGRRTQLPKASA
jgi:hypothetical protein